jgi:hypothetical protein
MTDLTVEPDDIHAAKDAVIRTLTNALIRAEAENAAWRRHATEGDNDDGHRPLESV